MLAQSSFPVLSVAAELNAFLTCLDMSIESTRVKVVGGVFLVDNVPDVPRVPDSWSHETTITGIIAHDQIAC